MKVVLDTNVLFAAFASHGLCQRLMITVFDKHELVLSEHILSELARHLQGKLGMTEERVKEIRELLVSQSEIVSPTPVAPSTIKDADDLAVLGTAIAGGAEALVTGDSELLGLKQIRSIPIVTPRECYSRMRPE